MPLFYPLLVSPNSIVSFIWGISSSSNYTSPLAPVFLVLSQEFRLLPTGLRWSPDSVQLSFYFVSALRKSNTLSEKASYSFFLICKERPFGLWGMLCLFFPHIMNSLVRKLSLFSLFCTVKYIIGPIKIVYINYYVFHSKRIGRNLNIAWKNLFWNISFIKNILRKQELFELLFMVWSAKEIVPVLEASESTS